MVRTISVDHIEYNEVRKNENGEYEISDVKAIDIVSGKIKHCDIKKILKYAFIKSDDVYDIIGIRVTTSKDKYYMEDQYYLEHSEKVEEKENN